jgi:hypothetical protein
MSTSWLLAAQGLCEVTWPFTTKESGLQLSGACASSSSLLSVSKLQSTAAAEHDRVIDRRHITGAEAYLSEW